MTENIYDGTRGNGYQPIREGSVRKGGINHEITTNRPKPPAGVIRKEGDKPLTEGKSRHAPKVDKGVRPIMPPPPPNLHSTVRTAVGRFCVNCDNFMEDERCGQFEMYISSRNPITGDFYTAYYECSVERGEEGRCGPEAKFWKPKIVEPNQPSMFAKITKFLRIIFS